ncbi:MAG: helix-turn-helix domain-containing protein [Acidimicrobiales bacterium]
MTTDEAWKRQAEGFGRFLRAQRKLAELSLRELAGMTDVSNAYLSQLERGLHQPSVRVLRSIADALNLSVEQVLAQFGLAGDDGSEDDGDGDGSAGGVEAAIQADDRLSDEQKVALIAVYRSYVQRD